MEANGERFNQHSVFVADSIRYSIQLRLVSSKDRTPASAGIFAASNAPSGCKVTLGSIRAPVDFTFLAKFTPILFCKTARRAPQGRLRDHTVTDLPALNTFPDICNYANLLVSKYQGK
jgi:hypothetical protein